MSTPTTPTSGWRHGLPGMPGDGTNFPPGPGGRPGVPDGNNGPQLGRPTVTIATYPDYPSAQRAVDFLADNRFPVQHTAIIGTNLTLVETVLGRMTTGRAALAGAATGAWFGLFIGLLFGIFTTGNWAAVIVIALVIGAVWGAIFGGIAHAMTGGRRDFSSASSLRAGQYAVTVDADVADQARQLLTRLNWQPATTAQQQGAYRPPSAEQPAQFQQESPQYGQPGQPGSGGQPGASGQPAGQPGGNGQPGQPGTGGQSDR